MNKFFALVAVMALCSVSMSAQYVNQSNSATISCNVAQDADVTFSKWATYTPSVGSPASIGGLTSPLSADGGTAWLVKGTDKPTNWAQFKVTDAAGAAITMTYTISSSSAAVTVLSPAFTATVADADPTVEANFDASNITGGVIARTTVDNSANHNNTSTTYLRGMCMVHPVTTTASAVPVTFSVALSLYSL